MWPFLSSSLWVLASRTWKQRLICTTEFDSELHKNQFDKLSCPFQITIHEINEIQSTCKPNENETTVAKK